LSQLISACLANRPCDSEVSNNGVPLSQEDVFRFDVAMHQSPAVGVSERLRDLVRDTDRVVDGKLPFAPEEIT
jgi:hypothetical protein